MLPLLLFPQSVPSKLVPAGLHCLGGHAIGNISAVLLAEVGKRQHVIIKIDLRTKSVEIICCKRTK